MKRAGKERTQGVRVRGVLTCVGAFLLFFFGLIFLVSTENLITKEESLTPFFC